jgi:hypothetical protein
MWPSLVVCSRSPKHPFALNGYAVEPNAEATHSIYMPLSEKASNAESRPRSGCKTARE